MVTETHLHREIVEQPEVLRRLLSAEQEPIQKLSKAIRDRDVSHTVIAARGTSDNAARYAKYVLGAFNGLTVALATPSLFSIYKQPPRLGKALVIGVSQSGKSPDIVAVLAEAKRQGSLTAVITNSPDSDLASMGDFVIDLDVGQERSVAATKSYTSELAAIALLSATLSGDGDRLAALRQVPDVMTETLGLEVEIAAVAPRYRYMTHCVVIGRGFNYATAFELALKMKELTYSGVEPYSSADFLHGPLALLEAGFPVIVVAPSGKLQDQMAAFMRTLNEHQAEVIAISDVPALLSLARIPLRLPRTVPEWLSPIVAIVPGQLLALHLAHTRDYDVDAPRTIRKVTETH